MPNIRVQRGSVATVGVTMYDQDGRARADGGPVAVTIRRANGATVVENGITVESGSVGTFVTTLSASDTSILDTLDARWTEQGGATFETTIEIVGSYYFSLDEARQSGPNLTDISKYPDALIIAARRAVEEECEQITGRAFVPRHRRLVLSGNDQPRLWLPDPDIRNLRTLSIGGVAQQQEAVDRLTLDGAGRITISSTGLGYFYTGDTYYGGVFPWGIDNVVVDYEYGLDSPPQRIKSAALVRVRDVLQMTKTGVPDRATFQVIEGRVFGVPQPGVRGSLTGIPEVDKAYDEWTYRRSSVASVPIGG